jgi:hypothetical protein
MDSTFWVGFFLGLSIVPFIVALCLGFLIFGLHIWKGRQ